jgi:hypothetical protein
MGFSAWVERRESSAEIHAIRRSRSFGTAVANRWKGMNRSARTTFRGARWSVLLATVLFSASATTITFEDLSHGPIVNHQHAGHRSFDLASVFDTRATGTDDPGLEDPFARGNAKDIVLGNILIINESREDPDPLRFVERPDDEAAGRRDSSSSTSRRRKISGSISSTSRTAPRSTGPTSTFTWERPSSRR